MMQPLSCLVSQMHYYSVARDDGRLAVACSNRGEGGAATLVAPARRRSRHHCKRAGAGVRCAMCCPISYVQYLINFAEPNTKTAHATTWSRLRAAGHGGQPDDCADARSAACPRTRCRCRSRSHRRTLRIGMWLHAEVESVAGLVISSRVLGVLTHCPASRQH